MLHLRRIIGGQWPAYTCAGDDRIALEMLINTPVQRVAFIRSFSFMCAVPEPMKTDTVRTGTANIKRLVDRDVDSA